MKKERIFYLYIATNKTNKVLYVGITNNLLNRQAQHGMKINKNSFTAQYQISKVVYYETYNYINDAIIREKQVKGWTRDKKLKLIREQNIYWNDLTEEWYR